MAEEKLPDSAAAWEKAVASKATDNSSQVASVGSIPQICSGSKSDFLLLRVLWVVDSQKQPAATYLFKNADTAMQKAKESLIEYPWFKAATEDDRNYMNWEALALWKRSAVHIAERRIILSTNDEVRRSLNHLLQGLSICDKHSSKRLDWSCVTKAFTVMQGDPAQGQTPVDVLTATTDGTLQRVPEPLVYLEDTDTYAILEAQVVRRDEHEVRIQMQEGAEMAAWISSQPTRGHYRKDDGVYRRIIISQDLDEIYITVGEYDDEYIQHIQGHKKGSKLSDNTASRGTGGFLIMKQFKAFRIEEKGDMLLLFQILVALMRNIDEQVGEDEKTP